MQLVGRDQENKEVSDTDVRFYVNLLTGLYLRYRRAPELHTGFPWF